jgi:hypothetical protein
MDPIRELHGISRAFGARAAGTRLRLLKEIASMRGLRPREQRLLAEPVEFLRAYPDSPRLLALARELAGRLPAARNVHPYSYGTVRRLARLFPGKLEIEWNRLEEEEPLTEVLYLLVGPGESQGLDDIGITLQDWFNGCKPDPSMTDLELLLGLLERSSLPRQVQIFLFESAQLPIRYRGPGRSGIGLPVGRIHYQKREVDRSHFPLTPLIRRPLGTLTRGGQRIIDLCLQALCARKLEIFPLIYSNPADVVVADCDRGVQVVLVGVLPGSRNALAALHFFMILKNGVPVAYGPANVLLGCCEMGINLFPEFRGAEIRYMYGQFMRVLHHRLGVDYFFLTRYGMGENNEEALRSGAFWFYRKLGFKPANPEVEEIARVEEAEMAADPGYRCDRRTLRRLSHTEAYFDLSRGKCHPLDLGALGMAQSRFIGTRFHGDRALAEKRCAARLCRLIGMGPAGAAVRNLAPLLCMIPDLPGWSLKERRALGRFLRAKDAPSEARAARLLKGHPRLGDALHRIASDPRPG